MDELREFLNTVQVQGLARDNFLGLLHVLIGRRVRRANGTAVSNGLTWREAASILKRVRWDRSAVTEIGLDPAELPPRERERFWYAAITRAGVDSPAAVAAGERLAAAVRDAGYEIGPGPATAEAKL
jgi:hypothetical protein